MNMDKAALQAAARAGCIREDQVEALWRFLLARQADVPGFRLAHVLYYLGGLVAIGAMSLFMTLGWERFGGWGLVAIALLYMAAALWLTEYLLRRRLPIPAGISATFAVVLVPLAVYGLQVALGFWPGDPEYRDVYPRFDGRRWFMELSALAAGAILLWRYRLPFLVMPVAAALWMMSTDIVPLLFDVEHSWALRRLVSVHFGLLMIGLAFWVDVRTRSGRDFAFWLYLFGAVTFWVGLTLLDAGSEWQRFGYCVINLGMILLGAVLSRRIFTVLGGIGVAGYLSYVAYDLFRDSLLFPFLLTLIGLALVWLGILWQRHEERLVAHLRARLPEPLRALLDRR